LAGSIREVLPVAFISLGDLASAAGGLAAAIAVGAFIGQTLTAFGPGSDRRRRRDTAVGGLFGLAVMSGLILLSINRW
jgi:hypothetical protein